MSDLIEDIDLEGYDAEGVEKPKGLPAGWYVVCVSDVFKSPRFSALVLKFEVHAGDHAGEKIEEMLWDPSGAKDAEKAKVSKDRRVLIAKRLGLIPDNSWGQAVRIDWSAAVGKVVVIQVKPRKYKDKDGNDKESTNVDYGGVFPLDDSRVPKEVRELAMSEGGGTPTTTVAAGGGTQHNPQQDFNDI